MAKILDRTTAEKRDRVRAHTRPELNERLDREAEIRVRYYAQEDDESIARRIHELEEEPDVEQLLEANAATLSLLGVVLGVTMSRKWLLVPVVVGAFLFQHAIKGWCPPVPAMRRMGVRTRQEIERERYALKAIRGDFKEIQSGGKRRR
jgi:hypothetical protein